MALHSRHHSQATRHSVRVSLKARYSAVGVAAIIVAALLVGLLTRGGAAVAGSGNTHSGSLATVSNDGGPPIPPLPSDGATLKQFEQSGKSLGEISLLATRGERRYFSVANKSRVKCYAVGPTQASEYVLGQVMCATEFSSGKQPIVDFTVFVQPQSDPTSARILRSEGFASDGVADIAFARADGTIVAAIPVTDNVYHAAALTDQYVTRMIARDASGAEVWSMPLARVTKPSS
jgi:hypothetical protein